MSYQKLLKGVYLFKDFSDAAIEKLSKAAVESFLAPGEELFSKGDTAHSLYVVQMGAIHIQQEGKTGESINVARLGTGSLFGEMAFIDGEKRSATATAAEKSHLIALEYSKIKEIMQQDQKTSTQFYQALAKFLCNRLRTTTTDLSFAKEKNLGHF